ncbi:MAG: Monoacylglycerol lipase [Verrucomicrobia subdivision 3 bacterium]|nr:Monoacylglycerol lipase [Limisphaerales bacterium]
MRAEVYFDQVHAYYYAAPDDKQDQVEYSLLIVHGIGGHGGTYDVFCEPLSQSGVNVYSMDLRGHGKAANENGIWRFEEWLGDMDHAAKEMLRRHPGKPVFALGSSLGAGAAFHVLAVSDAISGAVLMGMASLHESPPKLGSVAGGLYRIHNTPEAHTIAEEFGDADSHKYDLVNVLDWNKNYAANDPDILKKKQADKLRAWKYGYASMHSYWTYIPPIPPALNSKPVLASCGEDDLITPYDYVKNAVSQIGGPVSVEIVPKGTHQLMLYHTDVYIPIVDGWIRRQVGAMD